MKPLRLQVTKQVEFPDWARAMFHGKLVGFTVARLEELTNRMRNAPLDTVSAALMADAIRLLQRLDGCEGSQVLRFEGVEKE